MLDSEYHRIAHLKERVIEHSIKQINEHTDITATYEQHKKGRTITGFSFKFKQKKPKQAEIATETPKTATNDLDTIKPLTEPQIAKIQHDSVQIRQYFRLEVTSPTIQPLPIGSEISRSPEKADEQTTKQFSQH